MARNRVAVLVFLAVFVVIGPQFSGAFPMSKGFYNDLKMLMNQCFNFIRVEGRMMPPSPECCRAMRHANMSCVCKHMTMPMEKIMSMKKIAFVSMSCGRPLKRGSTCGSHMIHHME